MFFRDEFFFLSNFYLADFIYKGIKFTSSESAFQAMKCPERILEFAQLEPLKAKKLGREVLLRDDWNLVKEEIMFEVCYEKFTQNPPLKAKLIATGDMELVEGNTWGDCEWGVCDGKGENKLGKILMNIRLLLNQSTDFSNSNILGKFAKVIIERPIGSTHPNHSNIVYGVNYGYLPFTISGDGEEVDAYVLGVNQPIDEFIGKIIAIKHRTNDNEIKLVVAPKDMNFSKEEIETAINFQEKYFEGKLEVYNDNN